jgi:hypothetical protein
VATALIDEPPRTRRAIGTKLFQDVRATLLPGRTWLGVFFFVSPAGSFALGQPRFGARAGFPGDGYGGHLSHRHRWRFANGSGLFCRRFVAGRTNRIVAYSLAGAAGALAAAYMAFAPRTPVTYGAAFAAYAIANGFSFCMFTALVLEVVGPRLRAAATAYALLNASGNLSIAYIGWLDGMGYRHWGVRGLLGTDAFVAGTSAATLLAVAMAARRYWRRSASTAER